MNGSWVVKNDIRESKALGSHDVESEIEETASLWKFMPNETPLLR